MTAESRYRKLEPLRNHWIERGRKASQLTLPWLMPFDGDPEAQAAMEEIASPWSGIGQQGVHNMASRLLLALLPPTNVFFRFVHDPMEWARAERELVEAGRSPEEIAEAKTEIDAALALMERAVLQSIETSNDRPVLHEALLHLLIPGNCLLYMPDDGCKMFNLYRYVIRRDHLGRPLEAIVCEVMPASELPAAAKEILDRADPQEPLQSQRPDGSTDIEPDERTVRVFTHITWNEGTCKWYQEVKGHRFNENNQCPRNVSPWIPLRLFHVDSQDYSPGYIEAACMADLQTANSLTQACTEGALVSALVRFLAKPGAAVTAQQFNKARNGECLTGQEGDIVAVQVQKSTDLGVAEQRLQRVEQRLATSMMLNQVRDSERTTAEEVRILAQQIENSLGSVYSILTVELQHPYVSRKLYQLTKKGGLPRLPDDKIRPVVSVGLAAVGRGNDLDRHARFMDILQQAIGADGVLQYLMPAELIGRLAAALGIDTVGLIKTQRQLDEERKVAAQAQQQQALLGSAMADPQKLANAAATAQQMAAPSTPPTAEAA